MIKEELLASAKVAAVACEVRTGLPWQIAVAQWALESGWGQHSPGNNCFGIKAYPGCFGLQTLQTHEFQHGVEHTLPQVFATFPSLQHCFEKHALLITNGAPYRTAWRTWTDTADHTPAMLVDLIAPIYATDPHYADKLKRIMGEIDA